MPSDAGSEQLTVYTATSQLREPLRLWRAMYHDLLASRELAWRLFVRNISARYRQTALGYAWAILPPIFTTFVFVFLRNVGFLQVTDTQVPYAAFVLTGMVLWQTFTDALNSPLQMVTGSVSMLTKVNFPREALILVGVWEVLFSFLIRFIVLVFVVLWFGVSIPWTAVLFPIGALCLAGLGIMLGVLLTPLGVLLRDIGQGLPFLAMLWMFLTPVLYAPTESWPGSLTMTLNPVGPVLDTARAWLLTGSPEHLGGFLAVSLITLGGLLCGWVLYRLALPILIERMSA